MDVARRKRLHAALDRVLDARQTSRDRKEDGFFRSLGNKLSQLNYNTTSKGESKIAGVNETFDLDSPASEFREGWREATPPDPYTGKQTL